MENVWGTWTFFYIPAFLCGCAVGGAAMLALARKIIAKQARQIACGKMKDGEYAAAGAAGSVYTASRVSLRKAC